MLFAADLSWVELQAARLDGELYPLADAYCLIGELESPPHRARSVLGARSSRLIAELDTAAWIWGVPVRPLSPRFAVTPDARARLSPDQHAKVREVVYDDGDLIQLDGVRVTTPVRTVIDLARFDEPFRPLIVAQLAAIAGLHLVDCLAALEARPGIPAKNRAKANLKAALTQTYAVDTR